MEPKDVKRRVSFASTFHVRLFDKEDGIEETTVESGGKSGLLDQANTARFSDINSNNFLFSSSNSANQTPDQSLLLNESAAADSKEDYLFPESDVSANIQTSANVAGEETPVKAAQCLAPSARATPTTSFLFEGTSTPNSVFSRISQRDTPKAAASGRLSSFKATPRSISKFGLSSVKSSATPLLDRAISSIKKSQTMMDTSEADQTFDESFAASSFRVSPATTHRVLHTVQPDVLETEPRIALLSIQAEMSASLAPAAEDAGIDQSMQLDEVEKNLQKSALISEQAESMILDANSAARDSSSIRLDASFVKSEYMELDESTILKEEGRSEHHDSQFNLSFASSSADAAATPKKSDYASGYPRLSPAILQDEKAGASPATALTNQILVSVVKEEGQSPSSSRLSALDSPVIKAGLARLSQGKFRDSIAPFFRTKTPAKSSYTPKSVSSLRFSALPAENSPSVGASSPSVMSSVGAPSPAMGPLKRGNPRDSVANFFSKSNLRESMVSSVAPESPIQAASPALEQRLDKRGGVRDSIAPFFTNAGFDEEAASVNSDSEAMSTQPQEASILDESVDINMVVDEGDVSIQLDEASQDAASSVNSSFRLDQPLPAESQPSQEEGRSKDFQKHAKARDSVAAFFSAPLSADSSFQSNASLAEESLDLTENRKGNPFWPSSGAETAAAADAVDSTAAEVADESIVFNPDEASEAIMSTPHGVKTIPESEFQGLSPVVSTSEEPEIKVSSPSSSKRTSSRKTSAVKKVKVEHSDDSSEVSSPTPSSPAPSGSSPARVTRSRSRNSSPVKSTPKKSTAVTPMRRAVAQKALMNALASPANRGSAHSPKPTSSLRRSKRKSVGGDLLKTLEQEKLRQEQEARDEESSSVEPASSSQDESPAGSQESDTAPAVETATIAQEDAALSVHQEQDSFMMDSQAPESQSHFGGGEGMEDLMDEQHLSIMDASVVVEEEENSMDQATTPIFDLADFNAATGIKFGDYAVLSEEVEEMLRGSAIDCSIDSLETSHYHNGCVELMDKIHCLEEEAKALERNISANTPLLFDEFSQGTRKEREQILSQLKTSKEFCYELAKLEWYSWKGETLDYFYSCLQEDCRQLQGQREVIKPILAEFETVGKDVRSYYDELSKMVPLAREEVDAKMNHIQETSTRLIEEKAVRSDEMAAIRKKIQEIRQQTLAAQEATIQAEKKDAEYTARIANSERTCAELTVFDPADLTLLQAKYSVLTSSHGWKPLTLTPGKQTWLYDDILEAHFSNQGDSFLVQSNIHEYKPSNKHSNYNSVAREILNDITPERMTNMLKVFDKSRGFIATGTDLKTVLLDMSIMWESVKTLYRDLKKARHFTSAAIEWVDVPSGQSDLLRIKTQFFSSVNRAHVDAEFSFSTKEGMLYYPHGRWIFDYSLTYGNISACLKSKVQSIENGTDLVARCCRFIQETLNA